MNLIFLDIDGVLNGHDWHPGALTNIIRPECIRHLNRIIEATDCRFVLSSAWRYMLLKTKDCDPAMTVCGFEYLMRTHGTVGFRLLGTTGADEDFGWTMDNDKLVRGEQISMWLTVNRPEVRVKRYLAVDDEDYGITAAGIPLVQTNGKTGLDDEAVAKIVEHFQGRP